MRRLGDRKRAAFLFGLLIVPTSFLTLYFQARSHDRIDALEVAQLTVQYAGAIADLEDALLRAGVDREMPGGPGGSRPASNFEAAMGRLTDAQRATGLILGTSSSFRDLEKAFGGLLASSSREDWSLKRRDLLQRAEMLRLEVRARAARVALLDRADSHLYELAVRVLPDAQAGARKLAELMSDGARVGATGALARRLLLDTLDRELREARLLLDAVTAVDKTRLDPELTRALRRATTPPQVDDVGDEVGLARVLATSAQLLGEVRAAVGGAVADSLVMRRNGEAARAGRVVVAIELVYGLAAYLAMASLMLAHGGVELIRQHLRGLSSGDLGRRPQPRGNDEVAAALHEFGASVAGLADLVVQIRNDARAGEHASVEVSQAAKSLADGAKRMGTALARVVRGIETITGLVESQEIASGECVNEASHMVAEAGRGSRAVVRLDQRIDELDSSFSEIAKFVAVMEAIAFQANLLAMNAAVEASKAGSAGRGFAVVSKEVARLASRVQGAAQQIQNKLGDARGTIEESRHIVRQSRQATSATEGHVRDVGEKLNRLAAASRDGMQQIVAVNEAIVAMQSDHTLSVRVAGQMASASKQLRNHANLLNQKLDKFRT